MGIQKVITLNYSCDRCREYGTVEGIGESPEMPEGWLLLSTHARNPGQPGIGGATLCPDCVKWLTGTMELHKKVKPNDQP